MAGAPLPNCMRLQRDREIQRLNDTLEHRVRSRTAELQALNAELDSFAYSVSHDLKTPLRSIDGFTEILGEQLQDRLSPSEEKLFQRILGRHIPDGCVDHRPVGAGTHQPERGALAMGRSERRWPRTSLPP